MTDNTLWTWEELSALFLLKKIDTTTSLHSSGITGQVSIDTRSLTKNDLFIALAGDPGDAFFTSSPGKRDGHDFIPQAIEKGASAALVSQPLTEKIPHLITDNTLTGFWQLAKQARKRLPHEATVIGLTGSSGKTTLKTMLTDITSAFSLKGSLNNFWGLPLCMSNMPRDTELSIFELGMNRPGEIQPLAELLNPTIAIVLNILPVHIEAFTDINALAQEKLSIFKGLSTNGVGFYPYEWSHLITNSTHQLFSFGPQAEANFQIHPYHFQNKELSVTCHLTDETIRLSVPFIGEHRLYTLAVAVSISSYLKIPVEQIQKRVHSIEVPQSRGNFIEINDITLIDDSYNANPVSMIEALKLLKKTKKEKAASRVFALIGDMNELGDESTHYHLTLLDYLETIDGVFCVGTHIQCLYEKIPKSQRMHYQPTIDDRLITDIVNTLQPKDVLLVKASNTIFYAQQTVSKIVDLISAKTI